MTADIHTIAARGELARQGTDSLATLVALPASRQSLAAMLEAVARQDRTPAVEDRLRLLISMPCRDADRLADRLCRSCGCSAFDPCEDGYGETCSWVEADLCSCCTEDGEGEARQ